MPVPSAAPFAAFDDALPDAVEHPHVGVAGVVVDLREVGHDVRRRAAVGDDVVDARLLRHVLAHHVHHVSMASTASSAERPLLGRGGGVRGDAVEAELAALMFARLVDALAVVARRPGAR